MVVGLQPVGPHCHVAFIRRARWLFLTAEGGTSGSSQMLVSAAFVRGPSASNAVVAQVTCPSPERREPLRTLTALKCSGRAQRSTAITRTPTTSCSISFQRLLTCKGVISICDAIFIYFAQAGKAKKNSEFERCERCADFHGFPH